MFLKSFESKGLAHISYLLGDEDAGVAIVIDPRRDVDTYLHVARCHGVRITQVLETHIHADFVSGSTELAGATSAEIIVGAKGAYSFPVRKVSEGDIIPVGAKLKLQVFDTPGHTPEHVCFLVSGGLGSEAPWGLFTGDTLFAGEVGRPDLLGEGEEESLARQLYHTLFDKLLKLGDEIEIYPAHGKGSPCGASIGDRLTSTIGYERRNNAKLQAETAEEFIRAVLSDLPPAPTYYPRMKKINAEGPPALPCHRVIQPLNLRSFAAEREKENTVLLDTREIDAFAGAHIYGALNIALRSEFPVWAGWMLEPNQRILLVLNQPDDLETVRRDLVRVGIENIVGFLGSGMRGWTEGGRDFVSNRSVSVHELKRRLKDGLEDLQILDVRSESEWSEGTIPSAQHAFLGHLHSDLPATLDTDKPVLTYCGSGFRASIAASVLENLGFSRVMNLPGSMKAWKAAGFETVRPQ